MIILDELLLPNIRHAFLGREGGTSEGIYRSLNCGPGSSDDPGRVQDNRARAVAAIGLTPDCLVTAYQVHSARVVVVERPWESGKAPPEIDGMVTQQEGIALGILTADCAPVLFADCRTGVIGAAHAGWKGAKSGILRATVEAMMELGSDPADIIAGIGPCIAQDSYEVDGAFRSAFLAQEPESEAFFAAGKRPGHNQFDLPGYVGGKLEELGLRGVHWCGCDTFADAERFFSYRRTTHRGENDYGREISLIALAP